MSEKTAERRNVLVLMLKGLLAGVIFCLAAITLFAFVLKFVNVGTTVITIINQFIKLFAVFTGVMCAVREKGLLYGAIMGLLIVIVTFFLFGLISNTLSFGLSFVYECAFGLITGALSGVISSNLKKNA